MIATNVEYLLCRLRDYSHELVVPNGDLNDASLKLVRQSLEDACRAMKKPCYVETALALDKAAYHIYEDCNPAAVAMIARVRKWLIERALEG